MRIGIITHNYPLSPNDRQNAGIFVYDFAHALKKLGHEIFVLCPDQNGQAVKEDIPVLWFKWGAKGKKFGDLKPYNPIDLFLFLYFIFSGIKASETFYKKYNVDFVIGMWAFPAGIFAWWLKFRKHIPYALWALGSDIYVYAKMPILHQIIQFILKKANYLFADGLDLSNKVIELSGKTCEFLPSASTFPGNLKNIKKVGVMKFVFLGRMEEIKGVDVLVNAAIKNTDLDFELHIMGGGSLLEPLKEKVQLASLNKKILFYGNMNDQKEIFSNLQKSDWLVVPSRSDSIPLVFGEGMKAGLPMIVSEVGDMVELVRKYKVGISFKKEDIEQLSKIMADIIKLKNRGLIYQPGIKKLGSLFDINLIAAKLFSKIGGKR